MKTDKIKRKSEFSSFKERQTYKGGQEGSV